MHINPALVEAYIAQAGEVTFAANHDRKMTARVNKSGLSAALTIANAYDDKTYVDTIGRIVSRHPVGYSGSWDKMTIPSEDFVDALAERFGMPAYKHRAFELLVTLDLEAYKATRRLIVPADLSFAQLHDVLQKVFDWRNCHLYAFDVCAKRGEESVARLDCGFEMDCERGGHVCVAAEKKLSDLLPDNKFVLYEYDFGDGWEHEIELVRVIDEHSEPSPYLLEAEGQSPPEDVGGVYGFLDFREIMSNPDHPNYAEAKEWVGYWSLELSDWARRARVIEV